jgi:tetratricopeptide (TPR) repeat protein
MKKRVLALVTGLVVTAAAVAVAQSQSPLPIQFPGRVAVLSESQLQTLARQVTVKIDGQNPGSGVIIAKQGQTYYVLTAAHVVPSADEYDVVTPDGQKHKVDFNQVKKLPNTDLAIVPFTSSQTYTPVSIGSSSQVKTSTPCYVTGFPAVTPGGNTGAGYWFSDGVIEAQATRPLRDGYALAYYNYTFSGMSGGPVFDQQGKLIGIHGASKTRFTTTQGINPDTGQKVAINLGIPIDTFLRLAPQAVPGLQLPTAPPPINPPAQPTASDLYLQGVQAGIEGNTQAALTALNQSIKAQPNYAEAYAERGSIYLDMKDYKAALDDFNQAIRLNPNQWNFYNNRAIARFNLKDLQGSIADDDRAIQLKSNAITYYNRGHTHSRAGNEQKAIADYTQALQINPKYAGAYRNRGNVRSSLGQHKEAINDYNQALQLTPNDGLALAGRGAAKFQLEDTQGAIADYNAAIKANPKLFIAYSGRGIAYNKLGNIQAAMADYTEAIRLNPEQPVTFLGRGFGRMQTGDRPGAMADFNQALKLNSELVQGYYFRGLLRGQMGDMPGAISDLERTVELARKQNNPTILQGASDLLQKLRR